MHKSKYTFLMFWSKHRIKPDCFVQAEVVVGKGAGREGKMQERLGLELLTLKGRKESPSDFSQPES